MVIKRVVGHRDDQPGVAGRTNRSENRVQIRLHHAKHPEETKRACSNGLRCYAAVLQEPEVVIGAKRESDEPGSWVRSEISGRKSHLRAGVADVKWRSRAERPAHIVSAGQR